MNALFKVNRNIGKRLLALSTGKRINAVSDAAAGFSLARSLEARRGSLSHALENVGTASSVLSIAEGGYLAISDLLQTIKEKTVQAADDSFNSDQRTAIQNTIDALVAEIDSIVAETQFGGNTLIDGTFLAKQFQTGAGAGDVFTISLNNADASTLALTGSAINVSSAADASTAIAAVDAAIITLNNAAQSVGEFLVRLRSKEDSPGVAVANTEATRSRIEDADFAREQMQLVRVQIVQQTDLSALAQANAAPQLVLTLFRKAYQLFQLGFHRRESAGWQSRPSSGQNDPNSRVGFPSRSPSGEGPRRASGVRFFFPHSS